MTKLQGGIGIFIGIDVTCWIDEEDLFFVAPDEWAIDIPSDLQNLLDPLDICFIRDFPNYKRNLRIYLGSWLSNISTPLIDSGILVDAVDLPSDQELAQIKANLRKGIDIVAQYYQTEKPEEPEEVLIHMIAHTTSETIYTHSSPDLISFYGAFFYGFDVSSWINTYKLIDPKLIPRQTYAESTLLINLYEKEEEEREEREEEEIFDPDNLFSDHQVLCPIPQRNEDPQFFCRLGSTEIHQPFDVDYISGDYAIHGEGGSWVSPEERETLEQRIDAFHRRICQKSNREPPRPALKILIVFEWLDNEANFW